LALLAGLAGGLIAELGVREGPFPFPRATFSPREAGRAFANRGVRLAAAGYVAHMCELFAMYAWFSAFFADALAARGAPAGSAAAYATFGVFAAAGPATPCSPALEHVRRRASFVILITDSNTMRAYDCFELVSTRFGTPVPRRGMTRKAYFGNVADGKWAFAAPVRRWCRKMPALKHPLRDLFGHRPC